MATRKWGTEFLVNTTTAGNQVHAAVTSLSDGGFFVAWEDDGLATSVLRFQRYDAAGLLVGGEFTEDVADSGLLSQNQQSPAMTQLANGNLLIARVISPDHDIAGIERSLSGAPVRVDGAVYNWPYDVASPDVASLGTNGNIMIWQADQVGSSGVDIYYREFDASGVAKFDALLLNNVLGGSVVSTQDAPDLAANAIGTRYAVVWTATDSDAGDIYAKVFVQGGADLFALRVNGYTDFEQSQASVAWLDSGRFVVTWTTLDGGAAPSDPYGTSIHYRIFNDSGFAMGTERLANSTVLGDQDMSAVTSLQDGGFAIAWEDSSGTGGDNAGTAIRLQVFDSVGDKRGSEILVNTTTAGNQSGLSLATLSDGRIIVTWTDGSAAGDDTSGSAIRAQIIDPRDGIVTGTAAADTLYGNDAVGDEISGYDGSDTLYGLAGADALFGGAGKDMLIGGRGDDTLYAGTDKDTLLGNGGDDLLFGESGNDIMRGGAGDDELRGGSGNDRLQGEFGTDTMTGGNGNDIFRYSSLAECGDTITDFSSVGTGNNDRFEFRGIAFGGLPAGRIADIEFQASTAARALTADVRFFYETDTHILRYDADGNGAEAAIIIATLQSDATMNVNDILII